MLPNLFSALFSMSPATSPGNHTISHPISWDVPRDSRKDGVIRKNVACFVSANFGEKTLGDVILNQQMKQPS